MPIRHCGGKRATLSMKSGGSREDHPLVHPDDVELLADFIDDFLASDQQNSGVVDKRFIDKRGNTHWYASILTKVDYRGQPALQFVTRDITWRKRVEKMLKDSEERYRTFVTQTTEGIWRCELEKPCRNRFTRRRASCSHSRA